jgi:hypothetical protein
VLPLEPELPLPLEDVLPPASELAPALPVPPLGPFPLREAHPVAAANAIARAVPMTLETRSLMLVALLICGEEPECRASSFQCIYECCSEPEVFVTVFGIPRRKRSARDLARHA